MLYFVKMSAEQLNLRMDSEFVEQLETDAKKYGLRGKNSAAADILETYYPIWKEMQEEMHVVRRAHLERAKVILPQKRKTG